MGVEGQLTIRLKRGTAAANTVRIESTRPVHASRVFHGRSVADTQRTIPLLFSVCASAQACAGIRACEQALGVRAAAQTEQLRDQLVNMETLREHLWRILLDWPAFAGGETDKQDMAAMVAMQHAYRQALCPDGNLFQLGGADCRPDIGALEDVLARCAELLARTVFAMPPNEWLELAGRAAFADWAAHRQTIAARLIDRVTQAGWSDAGACESEALPPLTEDQLHRAMQDAEYVEQPQWSGQCCETSSLTRVDSPLLQALNQEYGNGLLSRLAARLTEIAYLAGRLMPDLESSRRAKSAVCVPVNPGIGQAAAARGQLVHRVELNGDVIGNYQILAPTEWNFHPRGVVVRALSGLQGDRDTIDHQARLLIDAIDPCVGYQLSVVSDNA